MSGQRHGRAPRGGSKTLLYRPERVAVERVIETRLTEMRGTFIAQVTARMERKGITRAELAARLGVSRGFVTQLFTGRSNLTMRTMAAITEALDCDLEIDLKRPRISLSPGSKPGGRLNRHTK
jgi:DNA-binding Xre family transcriptional regulator